MQCYPSQGYSNSESKYSSMSSAQQYSSSSPTSHGYGHGSHGYGYGGQSHGYGQGQGGHHAMQAHHSPQRYASSGMGGGGVHQQMHKTSSSYQSSHQTLTVFGTDPFCEISPSSFPPGTDPKIVQCFNRIDKDGNGVICDRELQAVLSSYSQAFSMRTVHLLMYEFTHSNKRMLGPKEFVPLLKCLQSWKMTFQRYDRDRNGSIDSMELGMALNNLGYCVSPVIVNLLIAKFTKSAGGRCSLQYDQFIEACLTVKGLTETFNAREECGRASFTYEEFLINVMPFIVA